MLDTYPANWTIPAIGPAYDTAGLARYWGVGRSTIGRRVASGNLSALTDDRGRYFYPAFQFDKTGEVMSAIFDLIAAIKPAIADLIDIATLIATRPSESSPADLLFNGNVEAALDRAREVTPLGPTTPVAAGS